MRTSTRCDRDSAPQNERCLDDIIDSLSLAGFPRYESHSLNFHEAPTLLPCWSRRVVDCIIVSLFVVHGLLLLSQRYDWFSINDQVDRAMAIDLAATVITLFGMLICGVSAAFMGCPLQFSLRSLSLLTISIAITSTWLGVEFNRQRHEFDVANAIQQAGGKAGGSHTVLSRLLNDKRLVVLEKVAIGSKYKSSFTDKDLFRLNGLRRLKRLNIYHGAVTDDGLEYLRDHQYLTDLVLEGMGITDAGMVHLAGLTNLRYLSLECTQVGDDGLRHLRSLYKLETLNLAHTRVSDHGASEFRRAMPDCDVIHW